MDIVHNYNQFYLKVWKFSPMNKKSFSEKSLIWELFTAFQLKYFLMKNFHSEATFKNTLFYLPWNPVTMKLLRTVIVLSRCYLEPGSVLADQLPFQAQIFSKASFLNKPVIFALILLTISVLVSV